MPYLHLDLPLDAERRATVAGRLGATIAAALEDELGSPPTHTIVEFTQHAGDEFWRADGLSQDWAPGEAR